MFTLASFPQEVSTDSEEFSTRKIRKASLDEVVVGFHGFFNSNLHLGSFVL